MDEYVKRRAVLRGKYWCLCSEMRARLVAKGLSVCPYDNDNSPTHNNRVAKKLENSSRKPRCDELRSMMD